MQSQRDVTQAEQQQRIGANLEAIHEELPTAVEVANCGDAKPLINLLVKMSNDIDASFSGLAAARQQHIKQSHIEDANQAFLEAATEHDRSRKR